MEIMKPTSIKTSTHYQTPLDVTYVQDDFTALDSNKLYVVASPTSSPIVEFEFGTPIGNLTGTQTVKVAFSDPNGAGAKIKVYDGGVLKFTSTSKYGGVVTVTFESSVLADLTGAGVSIAVVGDYWGNVNTMKDVGAIQWEANTDYVAPKPPEEVPEGALPLATLQANALDFTSVTFETILPFPDNYGRTGGNWDNAYISHGAIQYNLRWGTLQPIWKHLYEQYPSVVENAIPNATDRNEWVSMIYKTMGTSGNVDVEAWANRITDWTEPSPDGHDVIEPWKTYFHTLGTSPESIAKQRLEAKRYHDNAVLWFGEFGLWTRRGYAVMFEISTQKGGISQAVKDRVASEMASFDTTGLYSWEIEREKLRMIINASTDIDVVESVKASYRARKLSVIDGGFAYGDPNNPVLPDNFDLTWDLAMDDSIRTTIYVAKAGDTYSSLASYYGVTVAKMQSLNPMNATIATGEAINVPYEIYSEPVYPLVTILSVSKTKISDEPSMNLTDITFTFDVDVSEYTVNVNGTSYATGIVLESGGGKSVGTMAGETVADVALLTVQQISIIVAGMEIVAEIDWTDLSSGNNRVNIYGKGSTGDWTGYNQQ
ncbi:LysM repeat protein [Neobacillus niacini]|uniref:LysM peptidoglycan-binding domain-containing protein n=1 Tax=Neobacillus driksii TaxID=3035913 RepID=UPI00278A8AEE|nr:LysM domain-containing protein [Neobacillus niacini]MDQ0976621.1 LysM repeat protein [Neobacillus niacini]